MEALNAWMSGWTMKCQRGWKGGVTSARLGEDVKYYCTLSSVLPGLKVLTRYGKSFEEASLKALDAWDAKVN